MYALRLTVVALGLSALDHIIEDNFVGCCIDDDVSRIARRKGYARQSCVVLDHPAVQNTNDRSSEQLSGRVLQAGGPTFPAFAVVG